MLSFQERDMIISDGRLVVDFEHAEKQPICL